MNGWMTYEYQCEECQQIEIVEQKISEPSLTVCKMCGGKLDKLISTVPFVQFKGDGWTI